MQQVRVYSDTYVRTVCDNITLSYRFYEMKRNDNVILSHAVHVHTYMFAYLQCNLMVLLNFVVDNVAVVRTYIHTYIPAPFRPEFLISI